MLSAEVEYSINTLYNDARGRRYEFVTVEHLLLVMLDNPSAAEALRACAVDIPQLRRELEMFVDENTPLVPEHDQERDVQPTLGFQRVIHRAIYSAQTSRKGEVTGDAILVAIFGEPDSHAVYFLSRHRVSRLDIINFISHGIRKDHQAESSQGNKPADDVEPTPNQADPELDAGENAKPLEKYASNLNEMALEGKIDPLIGRDLEIERTIQVLCRRRKNNPLLVGKQA